MYCSRALPGSILQRNACVGGGVVLADWIAIGEILGERSSKMATVQEPDLFNDVEIMEISDFNPENDDNYVSVELLSENDDEDVDDGSLDKIPDCPPKDLLGGSGKTSSPAALRADGNSYDMPSISHHRCLSDHQYLVGNSMHHIVVPETANEQISMREPHGSERFSVSYDMDIRTQDLFNKESGSNAADGINNTPEQDRGHSSESRTEQAGTSATGGYDEYFQFKIEVGETTIQEYNYLECVAHEEVTVDDSLEEGDDEEEDKKIVMTLLNGLPCLSQSEDVQVISMDNDHSYTSCAPMNSSSQPTKNRKFSSNNDGCDGDEVAELINLSNKLAEEDDVTSTGAKQIVEQIERTVKSFRERQVEQMHQPVPESTRLTTGQHDTPSTTDIDSLSVELSANCSERMENEVGVASSLSSVVTSNENGNDDSGTDTDCTAARSRRHPQETVAASELDELISLGDCFTRKCEKWIKNSVEIDKTCTKTVKLARLMSILDTLKDQCIRAAEPEQVRSATNCVPKEKVEIAVQTEVSSSSCDREQRALNEKYKQTMLASSSDSSSLSESDATTRTSNLDSDEKGEDMMSDFVRRRRMRKSAKEKRNKTHHHSDSDKDCDGEGPRDKRHRRKQIYTDSSSESENERKESTKDTEDRAEKDDNLLDGVLSGVDDIMLDVHDILPAGEDVVQDYFDKEEQNKKYEKSASSVDRVGEDGSAVSSPVKNLKDMTESELEEYMDAQQDKEIDRLCNISYLSIGRNAVANPVSVSGSSNATGVKSKEVQKKKKVQDTMEDFLNCDNSNGTIPPVPSDHSDGSDKEEGDTEEQFLQKCNENMKYQLLNQLSSSSSAGSDDDAVASVTHHSDREENSVGSNEDSNASSASIVESFLKRLDTKRVMRTDSVKKSATTIPEGNGTVRSNEKEGTMPASPRSQPATPADEEMTELKDVSNASEADGATEVNDSAEQIESAKTSLKSGKLELADPKDRSLFSRDIFKDGENAVGKPKAKKVTKGKRSKQSNSSGIALTSGSSTEVESTGEDSDVEMLRDSSKKKRKRNKNTSLSDETFDFSEPLLSVTAPRKDAPPNSGVVKPTSQVSAKPSGTVTTASVPAISEQAPTAAAPKKQKSTNKDEQDCISLSSESDADTEIIAGDLEDSTKPPQDNKRKIRAMLTNDELAEETKKAQKEEEGRAARLKKKNEILKKFLQNFTPGSGESELVLDYDSTRKEAICVHPEIVKLLKPHQVEGIKFMYDNTYGSVDALVKHPGSGCILAHCMGLGKTLQMIALLHTVMRYPQLLTRRVLVICPKSTVMNWKEEIIRWQGTIKTGHHMKVYCFADVCTQDDKIAVLKKWFSCAAPNCGVMLIGYEAFRALINYERRKRSVDLPRSSKLERIKEYLLNPGADLVICDEGHQIKNKRSAISEAVSKIKTKRRIMLTGTPIQNNLKEYYCMVNFIKPSFLGSDKEFSNLYANPIKNGQCKDSDQRAIKIMKQRSYVLHNKLSKFVQRKEAAVLKEFLPEKYEYVLFVPLTPVQEKMYEVFLRMNEYTSNNENANEPGRTKKFKLIADYTSLRKIWTHPKVLEKAWESAIQEKNRKDAARKTATPDSYDESPDDNNDIVSGQLSVTNDWWRQFLETADLESMFPSNKLWIMFEILKQCNERGEKCLIFSAFVAVLNVVEHFMAKIHHQADNQQQSDAYAYSAFKGPWEPGKDYYRLDGKTHKSIRHKMITSFNDPRNTRTKCFLISAKAGGQGINLTGANRVIILDTSWNPSNDQQNIFRIFRLGQKRKCYVYRLLAMGTMEEKVYSRSVTKQALSFRVVDEQQIDRHYSYGELAELYTLTKVSEMTRETPILPADDVLALLLRVFPNKIFKYHEHDSLLENKPEQDLSEEEKNEAWAAYEREIQTNENRSLISAWGSVPQAALFSQPGPYSRLIDYWSSLGYPGMVGPSLGSGGDMFRTDYSYNRSLYNAYANAQQQQYSMFGDPSYSAMLSKSYGNYPVPGAGGLADFGSSMMNGQASGSLGGLGGAGKPYDPTNAFANLFNLYSKSAAPGSGSGLSSTIGGSNQSPLPLPTSSPLSAASFNGVNSAATSPHFSALKHMSDYSTLGSALHNSPPVSSTGLTISNIVSLAGQQHKSGSSSTGQPSGSGVGQGTPSMLSMLSEQAQLAAAAAASSSPFSSAGLSSPFSPRNLPLPPPTIETQMRNYMGTSSSKTQSPLSLASTASSAAAPPSSVTSRITPGPTDRSSSLSTSATTAMTTPIISSVVSMAPQASKTPDPVRRLTVEMQEGANKKKVEQNRSMTPTSSHSLASSVDSASNSPLLVEKSANNAPKPRQEASTSNRVAARVSAELAQSLASTALRESAKRPATPTAARAGSASANSATTIIPCDDDEEEDVRNQLPPARVRDAESGNSVAGNESKSKEPEKLNFDTNRTGSPYGSTKPVAKPVSMTEMLKNAKSLTNLTQPTKQAQQSSPLLKVSSSAQVTQTPPPIISTPEATRFQKLVRSNSSSPAFSGLETVKRPLHASMKLTPSVTKVGQPQMQQQTARTLSDPPRSPLTVQRLPAKLASTKATSNATQPPKPPLTPVSSVAPAISTAAPGPAGSTGKTSVKKPPGPPAAAVTRPPISATLSAVKSTPKTTPGSEAQQTRVMYTGKSLTSIRAGSVTTTNAAQASGAGLAQLAAAKLANSSNRLPTKVSTNESRPITMSLTPQQQGSSVADMAAAVSKGTKITVTPVAKSSPNLSSSANQTAGSPGGRSTSVVTRPTSVVQKFVPLPIKATTLANSGLNAGAVNRMPSPLTGGAKNSAGVPALKPANTKPNPVRMATSPSVVVNRVTKAMTPIRTSAVSSSGVPTMGPNPAAMGSITVARTPPTVTAASTMPAFVPRIATTAGTSKAVTTSKGLTDANVKPVVSYSFKHANKDMVITKATASPTIRQMPTQAGQHVVLKTPTAAPNAIVSVKNSAALTPPGTLQAGTLARQILPAGLVRAGNATSGTLSMANFQTGGTNNVFIRKRKSDVMLPDNFKLKNSSVGELRTDSNNQAKRTKMNDSPATPAAVTAVSVTSRQGTGLTIMPKVNPVKGNSKDDGVTVVELD